MTDSEAGRSSAMMEGEVRRNGSRESVVKVSRPEDRKKVSRLEKDVLLFFKKSTKNFECMKNNKVYIYGF